MNKIFKVVFNRAIGRFVVASEAAKGIVKSTTMSAMLITPVLTFANTFSPDFNPTQTTGIDVACDIQDTCLVIRGITIGKPSEDNNIVNSENFVVTGSDNTINNAKNIKINGDSNNLNFENQQKVKNINVSGAANNILSVSDDGFSGSDGLNAALDIVGSENTLSGNYAVKVFGSKNNITDSSNSLVLGDRNNLYMADNSKVIGNYNHANTGASLIFGDFNTGVDSTVIGFDSIASEKSILLGDRSFAGNYSIVLGHNASATNGNVALGNGSQADGFTLNDDAYLVGGIAQGEVSIGGVARNSEARLAAVCELERGPCDDPNLVTRRLTNVAAGANDYDAANIQQLKAIRTHFIGINSTDDTDSNYNGEGATGNNAIAIGTKTQSEGESSIAIGDFAKAGADQAIAIGKDSQAGYYSNVIGSNSSAEVNSNIIGNNNITSGYQNLIVGNDNINDNSWSGGVFGTGNNLTSLSNSKIVGDFNQVANTWQVNVSGNNNNVQGASSVSVTGYNNSLGVGADYTAETVISGNNNQVVSNDSQIIGNENYIDNGLNFEGEGSENKSYQNAVVGSQNSISANNTTVLGYRNRINQSSLELGVFALGDDSTLNNIVGSDNNISNSNNNTFGNSNTTSGYDNTVIGNRNNAYDRSIIVGSDSTAENAGIVLGNNAYATDRNIAIGNDSQADGSTLSDQAYWVGGQAQGEVSVGGGGEIREKRRITNVAAGANDNDAVNVQQLKAVVDAVGETFEIVGEELNGAVKYDRNADGSINFDSTSLQGQTAVIGKDGKYGVDVVQSGGTTISNVATATKADQAVNKGQMDVAIAGVQDGVNGAVKYDRNADGSINFDSTSLQGQTAVIGKDGKYGVDVVQSGGTTISNVATATKADQAVNKGQMDVAIAGVQDGVNGAVKYDRNADGSINFDSTSLQGQTAVIGKDGKYGVDVVQSGGTTISNVATATKADQAVNKGQMDVAIAGVQDGVNGAVKYDRNADGSINFDSTSLQGQTAVIGKDGKYGVDVVQSGGTTISNVATATKADQAVNKGQVDLELAKRDDALNGAVKYDRNADGSINFDSTSLQGQTAVIGKDGKYGVDVVQSGGTTISNVATATKADQAVNKGQVDLELAKRDDALNGAVKYDRNADGSINFDSTSLQGQTAVIGKDGKYGVDVVQSGGTTISNVATATKADQAVNKGQMDVAIAGVQDGVNGAVKYDRNADGSINFDSTSLQGQTAVIGKDGKYGVDVVQSGGTTISNVATATKADQAVNKGQMDVAIAGVQDGVNGAVKYDRNADGSINFDSTSLQGQTAVIGKDGKYGVDVVQSGGTTISNVATATKADQAVNKGQMDVAIAGVQDGVNGAVKYDRNADGSINFDSTSLQGQTAVIGKDGKYGVDVVQSGGTTISNVATATKADQAVNKGQMDVAIAGVQDGVNGAVKYDRNADGSINFDSTSLQGQTAVIGKDGKYGVDVVQSGGTTISNVATATKADQAVNKGQVDLELAKRDDALNGAVKYDRNADGSINYDSAKLQGKDATIGKDGKFGIDVVQSGGTTISNVATATKADQAVNKGQVDLEFAKLKDYADQGNTKTLNTANTYTDRKVEELQAVFTQDMGKLENKLSAGVAGAMAMASLAQPTTGRGTWGVALAGFNGQGALAWGMNGLSEDGKYIIKSAASFDTQGNVGGSISFNRQF